MEALSSPRPQEQKKKKRIKQWNLWIDLYNISSDMNDCDI